MIGLFCLPIQTDAKEVEDLAKKLANLVAQAHQSPQDFVAALISVPIQANYDGSYGPAETGSVWRINVQPVIPFTLTDDWNLISRTIFPVIDQSDIPSIGRG